ncbi:hypothetical protein B0T21DRAFT_377421 [Apiosordaria backusii]|uniref:Uncharacterized protein n=1 Tax=Apiosordaria backusii TaxID=314023 RepID=A0AA40A0V1_9PEZI|nr:hypothetical protein B0T21DRAFT_377421 [Apiosordaria backusii]
MTEVTLKDAHNHDHSRQCSDILRLVGRHRAAACKQSTRYGAPNQPSTRPSTQPSTFTCTIRGRPGDTKTPFWINFARSSIDRSPRFACLGSRCLLLFQRLSYFTSGVADIIPSNSKIPHLRALLDPKAGSISKAIVQAALVGLFSWHQPHSIVTSEEDSSGTRHMPVGPGKGRVFLNTVPNQQETVAFLCPYLGTAVSSTLASLLDDNDDVYFQHVQKTSLRDLLGRSSFS